MEHVIMTKYYTVGFMFNAARDQVVLIKKNRPDWQKGLLNGVGGHIRPDEHSTQGMVREFKEETGAITEFNDWLCFCKLNCMKHGAMVYFYTATGEYAFDMARTTEDEVIEKFHVDEIPWRRALANLRWLIPLALYNDLKYPVNVIE